MAIGNICKIGVASEMRVSTGCVCMMITQRYSTDIIIMTDLIELGQKMMTSVEETDVDIINDALN